MGERLRGMVLAAGYGTRLAPITDHVPKPLLTVQGRTLLERALDALAAVGCQAVAVNTHHLGGMITGHLATCGPPVPVQVFPEREILGTGGALDGARGFLGAVSAFVVHNGDVLYEGGLEALIRHHLACDAMATLLVTDWPAVNSVVLDPGGAVVSLRGRGQGRRRTYTGIGVFSPALLDDIPAGFSSLVDPLERALAAVPGSVQAVEAVGAWSDLGTPGRYLRAIAPEGETGGPLRVLPLRQEGSDRRFWRLAAGSWRSVAMIDDSGADEFHRQVVLGRALHAAGLGAAEILAVDEPGRALVMEDLGDQDLHQAAGELGQDPEPWLQIYAPVVDRLLEFQEAGRGALAEVPEAWDRALDQKALRWETDYFTERFLIGHLGLEPAALEGLPEEFAALAVAVAAQPRVLIHRDFQSRNILLQEGRVRLVDIQGLRSGPLFYDLASLLWDPYVAMPRAARDRLLERFIAGAPDLDPAPGAARTMFLTAALQRLMQALGAFGFLGNVKGRASFLAHMPRAAAHLELALAQLESDHDGSMYDPGPLPRLAAVAKRAVTLCPPGESHD